MNAPDRIGAARHVNLAADGKPALRVLMSSYRSHPLTGGQGVYMRHVTKALVELGHSADVISGPPYPALDPRVRLIELPSLDLYARPVNRWGFPDYPRADIRDWIDVKEWLIHVSGGFGEPYTFGERLKRWARGRIANYDILHDNQTFTRGLIDVMAMGLPVVGTMHHPITMDRRIAVAHAGSLSLKLLVMRWHGFLRMQKQVARRLPALVASSESSRRDAARDFGIRPERMAVTMLGIDHETFRPLPGIVRRANRLMATASADVPLKGLIYLIRAYGLLLQTRPDLELVVIGKLRDGPTAKLLDELGIRDRVHFVSGISDQEIARLYAEATIAVAPSVYEGFGFPAGEAMACGVPVVSTTGGSLPEVLGEAGVLVPPKDAPALARAIGDLLDAPDRRAALGAAARARVLERFRWPLVAQKIVDVYRSTLAHADRPA